MTRSFPDYLSLPISEITVKQVERWRTEKLMSGLKASTINRVVNALRAVLTKAVEWGILETHPLSKLKVLKIDAGIKARYLSDDEEKRLYHALKERDKARVSPTTGFKWLCLRRPDDSVNHIVSENGHEARRAF